MRSGRTCVVTGATRGIGRAVTSALVQRGCIVWAVCRSQQGADELRQALGPAVRPVIADLASLSQVERAARQILADGGPVHVLINNAAAVFDRFGTTPDGLERQWAINHVAPFLLTHRLLPRLLASAPARVLNVSSRGHALGRIDFDDPSLAGRYGPLRAYRQSKLANVLFSNELARRLAGTGVTANALHPGEIRTSIGSAHTTGPIRWLWPLLAPLQRPPERAAAEMVELALAGSWAETTGRYFSSGRPCAPARRALDPLAAARLWTLTERHAGLSEGGIHA